MNPRDFLALAFTLAAAGDEAAWRSAISRAYYAVFHVARDLLTALSFQVPRGDQAHGYLWIRLSNCGDAQVQVAGRGLNTLRQIRNQADYDLHLPIAPSFALGQVQLADQIIQILDAATQEPTRSQITAAMALYERTILRQVTYTP